MLKLILLRHAKSSWDDPELNDHDRPLAERGVKDMAVMSSFIKQNNLMPEFIFCSTAKRAIETLSLFCESVNEHIDAELTNKIYHGEILDMTKILSKSPPEANTVMLIGHNPGIRHLVESLTGKRFPYDKFGTSSIAAIDFDAQEWGEISRVKGELVLYRSPKNIE